MVKNIVVLGSTGSIGRSTLDVLRENRDRFRLLGLAAGGNIQLLERQIAEFAPAAVCVKNEKTARELQGRQPALRVFFGAEGLDEIVALDGCDCVVAAINGTDGIQAAFQALRLKRRLCLANKETLVVAGELIGREAAARGAEIIPVDSEQSAIFQCLQGSSRNLRRVILTASGGPFFGEPQRDLRSVTVSEALSHPTWSMGRKITIDSATLMNKALEIIEASHLFGLRPEQIDVVIHPQSVVHSLVEFIDSSALAQLGVPDMKLPILYSLTHPERVAGSCPGLDLPALQRLEFFALDPRRFPAIPLAYEVLRRGQNAGAIFNTANEVAVEYFLSGRIGFADISSVVARMLERGEFHPLAGLADVLETITATRRITIAHIENEVMP
ncbi:MAG: 1-deoxy-D-xylulose-5-phosphate reductoisomerase [Acidobacteria bacterium]|jgi:1-deoxy-D-xylulose-5-phosphate reductoisomerase|nr:1-deoxy-D-xylulose-5-phosphate reductoisomerase [Acidobacteriota bacterium]